jgi:hypothetical protein
MKQDQTRRMHNADLHVSLDARPGWIAGNERPLAVGEEVYCAVGPGEVAAILGKVSDGSRLLEIRLPAAGAKPYFAAASNVRVVAVRGSVEGVPVPSGREAPAALSPYAGTWLGTAAG